MMKQLLCTLISLLSFSLAFAGEGDQFVNVNAGFLFNSTLNASIGYEQELPYGNAKIHFGKTTIGMEGCSINRLLSGLKTPYFAFGLAHNLVHTKEIISLELKEDLNTTISSKMAYSFLSFRKTK